MKTPLIEAPTQDINQAYAVKLTGIGEWLIQCAGGEIVPLQDSIIENLCIKRSLSMEIYQWQATPANDITENAVKAKSVYNGAILAYLIVTWSTQRKKMPKYASKSSAKASP